MKDPIINNINKNRDAFENDAPDPIVWDKIENELHAEKKKRLVSLWFWRVAVILIIGSATFIIVNESSFMKKKQEIVKEEPDFEEEGYQSVGNVIASPNSEKLILNDVAQEVDYEYQQRPLIKKLSNTIVIQESGSQNFLVGGTFDISQSESFNFSVSNSGANYSVLANDAEGCETNHGMKRKLIRGGSWKDMGYFLQSGRVNFEYPDSAKSFNGYRTVLTHLGRNKSPKVEYVEPEIDPGAYYEQYATFNENKFEKAMEVPLSTFSIDVDAAGYSNMRRFINNGYLPPKNAVRLEEMVNYFKYDLPEPEGEHPFSITTEVGVCPWHPRHQLVQVAIKGKSIAEQNLPASNLVFLLDVSGSMGDDNKLPLLKKGLSMLVNNLRKQDKISIVVYAGAAGVVLPPTSGDKKETILSALNNLDAGGSTAGGEGIELAYKLAQQNFMKDGNNRIILATDGDFNVGVSSNDALVKLIEEKRKSGVFLSVLGFGEGNLQDEKMEQIADNGNGNYAYIDNVLEAKKVLVTEMGGTMHTIAKDVKLQLEFNPNNVESYRLLGYENRMLETRDFEDDTKDAGELGSGHTIVALYEIIPSKETRNTTQNLKYQSTVINNDNALKGELVTIKFRYKEPTGSKSKLIETVVSYPITRKNSNNFLFASAVAEFGLLIRESEHKGIASFENVLNLAKKSKGKDENGYRAEFIKLVEQAEIIQNSYFLSKENN